MDKNIRYGPGTETIQLNDFQQEVNDSIEQFWQAAQAKRGRVMGQREVFLMAAYIAGLTEAVIGLETRLNGVTNMLAAYTSEYGDVLYNTLMEPSVEAEIVEGQITIQEAIHTVELETNSSEEVNNDTSTEEDGRGTKGSGLDASYKKKIKRSLSEDQAEDH